MEPHDENTNTFNFSRRIISIRRMSVHIVVVLQQHKHLQKVQPHKLRYHQKIIHKSHKLQDRFLVQTEIVVIVTVGQPFQTKLAILDPSIHWITIKRTIQLGDVDGLKLRKKCFEIRIF